MKTRIYAAPAVKGLSIKQNVQLQGGTWARKSKLEQIQIADLRLLLTIIWVISEKLGQIARPLGPLQNKMYRFRDEYYLKNVQLDLIEKMADL